jgi:hypothetical protein
MRWLPLVFLLGCASIPTSRQAGVSFAHVVSSWPEGTPCLNKTVQHGIAKEVLLGRTMTVAIAAGSQAISDADWVNYSPSFFNRKNSDRHTLFARSCFSRSPSRPVSCVGDACAEYVMMDGHSWVALSKVEAADCLPDASACTDSGAKPGGLFVVTTRKCHELVFEGSVFMLHGPKGERAVMHATSDGHPTTDVVLPAGWSLQEETLTEPLVVHPFGGGDACFYAIIRDEKLQSYHQLSFAP